MRALGGAARTMIAVAFAAGCWPAAAPRARDDAAPVVVDPAAASLVFPATGALVMRPFGAPILVCTATLIAPRAVLTAGHCVRGTLPPTLRFELVSDVGASSAGRGVATRRALLPPGFAAGSSGVLHDIAVVELARPLVGVAPEPLLAGDERPALRPGAGVTLVGYGRTTSGPAGRRGTADALVTKVGADEITIGGPGQPQSCEGDSGGPAFVVREDGTRVVAGIVSRSANDLTDCQDGSIHTRVDAHAGWLSAVLDQIAHGDGAYVRTNPGT